MEILQWNERILKLYANIWYVLKLTNKIESSS